MGESGGGKSFSLREFDENEIGVFQVIKKRLPFKKKLKVVPNATYATIVSGLTSTTALNTYIIDDSQYLMGFEALDKAKEKGYEKFTENGKNFYDLIKFIINDIPDDTIVYLLHHTETTEDGKIKAKTIGKMLDTTLKLEGMFTVVLLCESNGVDFKFITKSDGSTTAKSPIDMFEEEINNDLKMVDDTIREYWEIPKRKKLQVATKTNTTKESK